MKTKFFRFTFRTKKRSHSGMAAVGFEPTPPQRLVPKTSALDHSATLPTSFFSRFKMKTKFFRSRFEQKKQATWAWQRWDSNPRLLRDWCLKPAP
ncbi:hypothetical protein CDAR_50111 [Caerostris darwini]|uniref:Uncharacterized protein n=1 Tax=Caerostris darwini TaxID=1538125 RepID=A0AAV4UWS5_9ARAC|nr:hypothetical protein CDAR_50111 [Caerostris darwini]